MGKLTDYQRSVLATAKNDGYYILFFDYETSELTAEFSDLKSKGLIATEIGPYPGSTVGRITDAGRLALEASSKQRGKADD